MSRNQETKFEPNPKQWGGWRPGGGRPRGSRSNPAGRVKPPKEAVARVVDGATTAALSADDGPLEIMDRFMRGDPLITHEMFLGAKELAPYRFPKLSAIAVAQADPIAQLSRAEKIAELKASIARSPGLRAELLGVVAAPSPDSQSCDPPQTSARFTASKPLRTRSGPTEPPEIIIPPAAPRREMRALPAPDGWVATPEPVLPHEWARIGVDERMLAQAVALSQSADPKIAAEMKAMLSRGRELVVASRRG